MTVGPRVAPGTLRKVLSLGADRVVHVMDDDPCGTDAPGTSLMLARAVRKAGYDLVVAGMARADGTLGVVSALLSEHLGVPSSPGRPRRGARTVRPGQARRRRRLRTTAGARALGVTGRRPTEQRMVSWSLTDLGLDTPEGTVSDALAAAWARLTPTNAPGAADKVAERPSRTVHLFPAGARGTQPGGTREWAAGGSPSPSCGARPAGFPEPPPY
ncbi:hypothetical protein [Streptomyces sp. NPDC058330]|uniref:hypothetical protein n=1 Tax=Streptomyces sp. NPDC058330 TaxID=3346449 RepID=UPI0036E5FD80